MSDLLKERLLVVLALLLCVTVCLLAVVDAPDVSPVGVIYSDAGSTTVTSAAVSATRPGGQSPADFGTTSLTTKTTADSMLASGKININTATFEQLKQLDGIGDVLARRILDYRVQHGDFDCVEEIQEVSGIGEKRFEAIKDSITVD